MINLLLAMAFLTALTVSAVEAKTEAKNAATPPAHGPFFSLIAVPRQEHNASQSEFGKGQCNYFIISIISTKSGQKTLRIHGLLLVATAWGQSFSVTNLPPKPDPMTQSGEVLTVLLSRTADPARMRAKYEDTLYERGKIQWKFTGIALLTRPPAPNSRSAGDPGAQARLTRKPLKRYN